MHVGLSLSFSNMSAALVLGVIAGLAGVFVNFSVHKIEEGEFRVLSFPNFEENVVFV